MEWDAYVVKSNFYGPITHESTAFLRLAWTIEAVMYDTNMITSPAH